jgi:hypothetical protein
LGPGLALDHAYHTENADAELGAGDVRQLDGAGEALVLLRVVVLQADLKLDRLHELALLLRGALKHSVDALAHVVGRDLRHLDLRVDPASSTFRRGRG